MEWLFFALMAPFMWAVGSTILKFMRTRYIKNPMGYIVFIIPSTFVYYLLVLFEPFQNPGLKVIIIGLLSGIISITSYYIFIYALHRLEVSRATTLAGTTPLFALILATIFLKEILSVNDYIGFFLIVSGSFLVTIKKEKKKLKISHGALLIILSSFLWAVYNLILKYISATNFSTTIILRQIGMFTFIIGIFAISKNVRSQTKETIKNFNLRRGILAYSTEIIGSAGVVFSYLAIQRAPVSLVTLFEGFEPLFVILFISALSIFFPHLLKEVIDKKTITIKILSALLMLLGLYLILI